mmetsp:Transcript_122806/g.347135  ORF Transcript_122806/g.347135 Transcript_122806/m.347135 type:complete len:449 (-) Transcript_122806:2473-3819(-)
MGAETIGVVCSVWSSGSNSPQPASAKGSTSTLSTRCPCGGTCPNAPPLLSSPPGETSGASASQPPALPLPTRSVCGPASATFTASGPVRSIWSSGSKTSQPEVTSSGGLGAMTSATACVPKCLSGSPLPNATSSFTVPPGRTGTCRSSVRSGSPPARVGLLLIPPRPLAMPRIAALSRGEGVTPAALPEVSAARNKETSSARSEVCCVRRWAKSRARSRCLRSLALSSSFWDCTLCSWRCLSCSLCKATHWSWISRTCFFSCASFCARSRRSWASACERLATSARKARAAPSPCTARSAWSSCAACCRRPVSTASSVRRRCNSLVSGALATGVATGFSSKSSSSTSKPKSQPSSFFAPPPFGTPAIAWEDTLSSLAGGCLRASSKAACKRAISPSAIEARLRSSTRHFLASSNSVWDSASSPRATRRASSRRSASARAAAPRASSSAN